MSFRRRRKSLKLRWAKAKTLSFDRLSVKLPTAQHARLPGSKKPVTPEALKLHAKTHRGTRPLLLWHVQRDEGAAEVVAGLRKNQTSGSRS